MDSEPAAASGMVLRNTGLPSRSALVAPPLRLAALRWRVAFFILVQSRPPPGVSTAFLVAVARFSGRPFPRVPPLRMCPYQLGGTPAHSQGRHARRGATSRAQRGARFSGPGVYEKGRNGVRRVAGPTGAVPVVSPVAFRSPVCRFFFSDDWLRHARFGEPRSAAAPLGTFLRCTGLPSRSALIAPPLRLAALRWREASFILVQSRPPPGVSTACLVVVTRFSGRPFPRVPPLRMCPSMLEASAAHSQGLHARRFANSRAQRGP
jgi:hypothetical protein